MIKKTIITFGILCFYFAFSQTNNNYIMVDYSSICCGPPSGSPIMDYLEKFEKQNKLNNFEIWVESGLGKEGEHRIYIGIDQLNEKKKTFFWNQLKQIAKKQNDNRKENEDGYVGVGETFFSKKYLKSKKLKPSTRISTLSIYKYQ